MYSKGPVVPCRAHYGDAGISGCCSASLFDPLESKGVYMLPRRSASNLSADQHPYRCRGPPARARSGGSVTTDYPAMVSHLDRLCEAACLAPPRPQPSAVMRNGGLLD